MPWLLFLLSLAALGGAFTTTSIGVMLLCLGASLLLGLGGLVQLLSRRIGSRSQDASRMLDPVELQRLREAAQARPAGTGDAGDPR